MKKVLVLLSSLLLIVGMLLVGTACVTEDTTDGGNTAGIASFEEYGTLQGRIMDAITGEAIGGGENGDLEVYLIQGTDEIEPDKLITDEQDNFKGEYAFEDVPVGLADASGELVFKLIVIKPGYMTYTDNIELSAELVGGYSNNNDQIENTFANDAFNFIQNISLFPKDAVPGDVNVYVYGPDARPLSNASVYLQQSDYLEPILSPDSSDGNKYVFNSANLALRATYSIMIEPMTVDGQELAMYNGGSFTVGINTLTRTVNMNVVSDSAALLAVSASNQVPGTIASDGKLTIKFNQPVNLDKDMFGVTHSGDGVLNGTTPVTASLADGNKTLILTPNFDTNPSANGSSVTYSYSGSVILQNSQTDAGALFTTMFETGVTNIVTGNVVSATVLMKSN